MSGGFCTIFLPKDGRGRPSPQSVNRMACLERGGGETFDLEISRCLATLGVQITCLSGAPLFSAPPAPSSSPATPGPPPPRNSSPSTAPSSPPPDAPRPGPVREHLAGPAAPRRPRHSANSPVNPIPARPIHSGYQGKQGQSDGFPSHRSQKRKRGGERGLSSGPNPSNSGGRCRKAFRRKGRPDHGARQGGIRAAASSLPDRGGPLPVPGVPAAGCRSGRSGRPSRPPRGRWCR